MFAFAAQFTHSFTDTLCVIAVITYSMSSMKNRRKLHRKKEYFFPQRGFQLIKFKETDSLFFFPVHFSVLLSDMCTHRHTCQSLKLFFYLLAAGILPLRLSSVSKGFYSFSSFRQFSTTDPLILPIYPFKSSMYCVKKVKWEHLGCFFLVRVSDTLVMSFVAVYVVKMAKVLYIHPYFIHTYITILKISSNLPHFLFYACFVIRFIDLDLLFQKVNKAFYYIHILYYTYPFTYTSSQ